MQKRGKSHISFLRNHTADRTATDLQHLAADVVVVVVSFSKQTLCGLYVFFLYNYIQLFICIKEAFSQTHTLYQRRIIFNILK